MHRRKFLISSAALTLPLAGCTGDQDAAQAPAEGEETTTSTAADGTSTITQEETTEQATEEATQTETAASESGQAEIVIDDAGAELAVDQSGFTDDVYVAVDLTNVGNAPSGKVTVEVDWLDANGDYLSDWWSDIIGLKPGETWSARVYAALVDDELIEDYDVYGDYEAVLEPVPEGVDVASSSLLAGEENVKVRGEVENNMNTTLDYVEFHGNIYNDAGEVMGGTWTNETDIPVGSSTRFDPPWDEAGDRASKAIDHEVVLQASVY